MTKYASETRGIKKKPRANNCDKRKGQAESQLMPIAAVHRARGKLRCRNVATLCATWHEGDSQYVWVIDQV